ncbi:hypothetical protein GCM10009662_29530 [Catellatospora coxensis]
MPANAHTSVHSTPATATTPNADRHPCSAITQVSPGAAITTPNVVPAVTSALGRLRLLLGNHDRAVCCAIGNAGPSAAPSTMREVNSMATPAPSASGACDTDQSTTMPSSSHRGRTRSASSPPTAPKMENSRKNALFAVPNWVADSPRSSRIDSAARPRIDLSAKLIIMKTTSNAVMIHARRRSSGTVPAGLTDVAGATSVSVTIAPLGCSEGVRRLIAGSHGYRHLS